MTTLANSADGGCSVSSKGTIAISSVLGGHIQFAEIEGYGIKLSAALRQDVKAHGVAGCSPAGQGHLGGLGGSEAPPAK